MGRAGGTNQRYLRPSGPAGSRRSSTRPLRRFAPRQQSKTPSQQESAAYAELRLGLTQRVRRDRRSWCLRRAKESGKSVSLPYLKAIITSKERKARRELTVSRLGSTDRHPQRTLLLVGTPSRARRLRRSSSDGGGGDRSSTGEDGSGGCGGAVDDRGGSSESWSEGGEHILLVDSCLLLYALRVSCGLEGEKAGGRWSKKRSKA